MNTKHIIAAIGIALAGSGAFAAEYTNFDIPSGSNLSRAVVKAELARARTAGELNRASALYGYFEPAVVSVRTREEVRAEAFKAAHDHGVNTLYVGA